MAGSKCDHLGHEWHVTTAPGWFRCGRVVDHNLRKERLVLCNAVAVCPGCLGYHISGVYSVPCVLHQSFSFDAFPVVTLAVSSGSPDGESYQQGSLW
jgi:hypothetical protein